MVAYSPLGRGMLGGKAVVETLPSESQLVYGTMKQNSSFFSKNMSTTVESLSHCC